MQDIPLIERKKQFENYVSKSHYHHLEVERQTKCHDASMFTTINLKVCY
jgi:hypothetical protein